ncbi:MAG TPA: nitroreductase family protein [Candidatus Cryosericum sp.]|nr:nitroreductase family protein [Candidatus Cryosericum sp.]
MDVMQAIASRRSIRKFTDQPVPEEALRSILTAATLAPSAKNRQPWRFVVVTGEEKRAQMIRLMRAGIDDAKAQGLQTGTAIMTARVMERAPVTIFVFNPLAADLDSPRATEQRALDLFDTESVGAAVENMILAAQELGLGTLWMGDIWSAYRHLSAWLGEPGLLAAAVAVGYPAEQPAARPRKSLDEVVRWF